MTTRVAVVGCGDVSTVHLDAIAAIDGIELVAVCDTDPDVLECTATARGVPGFTDHRALLAGAAPDAVHVCTPHHQHVEVTLDLLESGVRVLLEKPLAHTVEEAGRIVAAAERTGTRIGVCLQNRYNETSRAVRRILGSGELGAVRGATATVLWTRDADYYRAKPWRGRWATAGGGLLINQAIHTLDLVEWFLGEVVEVSGSASTRLLGDVIEVEDTAELLLSHAGGARSVLFGSLANVVHAPVTVDVTAEHGSLSIRGDLTVSHADGRTETVTERRASSNGRSYWGVAHEALIRDFHSGPPDEPFWIGPREAMRSLRVLTDVYRRSRLGPAHPLNV
ncbi:Gfo/Idh/MocA family protein [Pseudonocardia sp. ICBG1293]|uniref:Gfo/Idh/MocA family protein n=1 Tax=Pseudonocardia sp. ICBG1293 TaxID=2844382 RepID=UPI001CCDD60D|nr:Gfo/Idh/MocA family oxidoreductase [Pseudonocardia sp. ICBG1293]